MIIDTISQAHRYIPLHPDFGDAIHLLQTLDFAALPDGQIPCHHPNIRLFIGHEAMRTREAAQAEAHLKHIDIQVPLSGTESYGFNSETKVSERIKSNVVTPNNLFLS